MTCDEQPDGGCEMGDTPRTDAAQGFIGTDDEFYKDTRCGNYVEVDHARTLERELSAARAELEACRADLAPRGLERAEPVTYGIDWGRKNGDRTVCSVFKLLPDGTKELIACEYQRAEYETQAFSESSGTVQVPRLVATAPERIYLGVFDDADVEQQDFPEDHEGITWCQDNVGHADVEYIRADLAAPPSSSGTESQQAEMDRLLRGALKNMKLMHECEADQADVMSCCERIEAYLAGRKA